MYWESVCPLSLGCMREYVHIDKYRNIQQELAVNLMLWYQTKIGGVVKTNEEVVELVH